MRSVAIIYPSCKLQRLGRRYPIPEGITATEDVVGEEIEQHILHTEYWSRVFKIGLFVPSHYNFQELEERHYYSSILKFAITIFLLPHSCHFLRLPAVEAHCQTVFVCTCVLLVLSPLTDMWTPPVSFFLNLRSSRGSPWAADHARPA
jgi:hypothetical protein